MPSNIGSAPVPEPAVAAGEDPRRYARLMSAVYDATMAGNRAPARPREVIGDSWQRLIARGIDPDVGTEPVVETGALEMLRRASGLMEVLDEISHGLESLVAEGANILVVADAKGRVLWRSGSPAVLMNADRLGFVEGANWGEGSVAPTLSAPRWCPSARCRCSLPSTSCAATIHGRAPGRRSAIREPGR